LDVGGEVFMYADLEGDLSAGAVYLDRLLKRANKAYPDLKLERIHAKRLLEQLGLDQILALGLSSTQDGKVFHNKSFLQYGKTRRGLLLLTEAPPRELEVIRQAPADADVVFETDLRIKSLLDLIEAIAKDMAGDQAKDLFANLDEKIPGTGLRMRQLLEQLDTRLLGVLRVDFQRSFVLPTDGKNITIPGVDLLLGIDNMAMLFDAVEGLLRQIPGVTTSTEGDWQLVEVGATVPGATWLKPVLAKERKTGRLILATSMAFMKEFLADKSVTKTQLAQAPDFKKATAGFQSRANGLTYMSGAFLGKLAQFMKPLGKADAQLQTGLDFFFDFLPEAGIPFAAQQVNLPDGLYYASNATTSHKSTLFPALVAAPLLAGAGAAALVSAFNLASYKKKAAKVSEIEALPSDDAIEPVERAQNADKPAADEIERYAIPVAGPARGAAKPTVNIVEFADFQCPFSQRATATMRQLLEDYPKDVRLTFRNLPLPFHANAALAAQAAMAADAQGKFWQMHDKLFANQQHLTREDLDAYAPDIGLDLEQFKAALDKQTYKKAVDEDAALAAKWGAVGTPAFFVNGRPIQGAQPLDKFKKLVDDELARANKLLASGTVRDQVYAKLMAGARPSRPVPAVRTAEAPTKLGTDVYKISVGKAPARGGKEPKVTIIEFADFQCPFCARANTTLDDLAKIYGNELRLVFKHNPLPFHDRAMPAALAAEAAREQGKFWAMHDKLFADTQHLSQENLEKYAGEIGLDVVKFNAALKKNSEPLRRRIAADQAEAGRFGAVGTPNFFINGRPLRGAYPLDTFKTLIDEESKKADEKLRKGIPRAKLYAELTKNGLESVPKPKPSPGEADSEKVYRAQIVGAPVRGAKDALVTIVQFSDYQCPFCRRAEPTITKILAEYKGKVRVAWRDLPLPFHANAKSAAIAARAAGLQGKYWQMHDKLFEKQEGPADLAKANLERYAEEIGLNVKAFKTAMQHEDLAKLVEQDISVAHKLGVQGTPGFFINGKFLSGALPFETFKSKIDDELKRAQKMVAKGTPKAKVYTVIMRGALEAVEEPAQ
jgi:protein-disulfide isomerase